MLVLIKKVARTLGYFGRVICSNQVTGLGEIITYLPYYIKLLFIIVWTFTRNYTFLNSILPKHIIPSIA